MPSSLPQFTVRMNPILLKKLHYVASYNARSASKEVEFLIRKHIESFEKEHGLIELDKDKR